MAAYALLDPIFKAVFLVQSKKFRGQIPGMSRKRRVIGGRREGLRINHREAASTVRIIRTKGKDWKVCFFFVQFVENFICNPGE